MLFKKVPETRSQVEKLYNVLISDRLSVKKTPKTHKEKVADGTLTLRISSKTTDKEIGESFVFEKTDFRIAKIHHTFFINEIIIPEGETDFAKIREMAKRKGKIVREAIIDEQEVKSEKGFVA